MYSQIEANKRNSIILFMLFFILIGVIVYVLNILFFHGYVFVIMAAIIAVIFSSISYYSGDKIVLAMSHAKEANKKDHSYLINAVEGLSIAAGIPRPKVYTIPGMQINAFACGRSPKTASVVVTEGALSKLSRQELEGVIAHELSHIKNYDIRVMVLASVLVGIIVFISEIMIRSFIFGGVKSNENSKGSLNFIFIIIGVVLLILAPIIAQIIKFAISKKREYLADASGALLTRYPKGLADALRKIKNDTSELKIASNSLNPLFISSVFKKKQFLTKMFVSHPPLEDRIKKLEGM